jgi:hypothetical protein
METTKNTNVSRGKISKEDTKQTAEELAAGQKRCSRCSNVKPLASFCPAGTKCRACLGELQSVRRQRPDIKRRNAIKDRLKRERSPELYKNIWLSYLKRHPDTYTVMSSKQDPLKKKCRQALRNAVSSGRIVRPEVCSKCQIKNGIIQAHHHDYSKPFEVAWLCSSCHGKEHRKYE